MKRTALPAALACAAIAAALAGCGGSTHSGSRARSRPAGAVPAQGPFAGMSARQIADQAMSTMKNLHSVTMDSASSGGATVRLQGAANDTGACHMHAVISGSHVELLTIGQQAYLKADTAFWKAQSSIDPQVARRLGDHWATVPGNVRTTFTQLLCDPKAEIGNFSADEGDPKTMARGAIVKINGQDTIPISEKNDSGLTTLYVATTGRPYILKAVQTGDVPTTDTFTDFNKPLHVTAPQASQIVDATP